MMASAVQIKKDSLSSYDLKPRGNNFRSSSQTGIRADDNTRAKSQLDVVASLKGLTGGADNVQLRNSNQQLNFFTDKRSSNKPSQSLFKVDNPLLQDRQV